MYEAALVGIELFVMIPAIFVIGFILWWFKHDKEAYLRGNLSTNPRKKNALIWGAICALFFIWVIYIEMQADDPQRIQGNTITGVIEY